MDLDSNYPNKNLETALIIQCSQTQISQDNVEKIRQLLMQSLDWKYIISVAGRNALLPLLSVNLLDKFEGLLPSNLKDELSDFSQNHTQNNLFLTLKLIEIVKTLERTEISALPFKGPTLALRAYGNLSLRQYCDLDILVKPKDFDDAVKVLSVNGYTPISKTNWLKRKLLFFTHKKDVILMSSDNRVQIELHWKLSGSQFSLPFEISELWSRLNKLNLGGAEVNILSFNDLFIYLCLHGSRHEWERFSWICDIRELIGTFENSGNKINWTEIRQHARNHGCEKVVELGLFLVQKFFGVKTNYPDYEEIENNAVLKEVSEQIQRRIFALNYAPSLKRDKYMYLLALQEKRTHRLKLYLVYLTFYLKLLFTPNTLDKSIFHLPSFLSPLYYILRPVRLSITYFNSKFIRKIMLKK